MADKKKTAVEACRDISKALKAQLEDRKKDLSVVSPKDAGLKVTKATLEAIKDYRDQLIKMQAQEEGEELAKSLKFHKYGKIGDNVTQHETEDGQYTINHHKTPNGNQFHVSHEGDGGLGIHSTMAAAKKAASAHASGKINKTQDVKEMAQPTKVKKPKKSVFAKKINKRSEFETANNPTDLEMVKPEERDSKDSVLPSDKNPVKQEPETSKASGGDIKAGKKLKKSESTVLSKSFKSHAQKMMAQHANIAGSLEAARNSKMPAKQQTMKLPSPSQQAKRATTLSGFTPKGKFDQGAFKKDCEEMDGYFKKNAVNGYAPGQSQNSSQSSVMPGAMPTGNNNVNN